MLPRYRMQVRKEIHDGRADAPTTYVFRDLEIPFMPMPGLVIQDFDGEQIRIGSDVVWREGQHRFIVYETPHEESRIARERGAAERALEEIITEYEAHGWTRNRRTVDRVTL